MKIRKSNPTLLLFTTVLSMMFIFFTPSVPKAEAFMEIYGGQVVFRFNCTCSETWLLFIKQPKNMNDMMVKLVYSNTPQLKRYQLPRSSIWSLGFYMPGAGICYYYVPPDECIEMENDGMFSETVGTSMSL